MRIEALGPHHRRDAFSCGVPPLDDYLRQRAGQDQRNNMAACYVLVDPAFPEAVRGYYTLSSYAIELRDLPPAIIRKLPRYPRVPAALLGRLAVDRQWQSRRLGEFLLVDALARTLGIAGEIGVHAVIVDAPDDEAAAFYRRYGFAAFPSRPLRLFLAMRVIGRALGLP